MTSTRIPIPTNLKERIAALEQRNAANGGANSRPISPTPSAGPTVSTKAHPAAFRDKIAKFEKKGGVPVPRGSFGLGAPPTSHGPSRQGELYGNRIPAPARTVSNGVYPVSRAASPTGGMSTPGSPHDRRSFSLSSVISDDDNLDYTPVSSPTFAFPPDSPESVSVSLSPEPSPTNTEIGSFNRPIVRGTSFQKALEIARNAELAKLEGGPDPLLLTPRLESPGDEDELETPEPTPVIVVSSEDTTPMVLHESPTVESNPPTIMEPPPVEVVEFPVATPNSELETSLGPSIEPEPQIVEEVPAVEVQAELPPPIQPLPIIEAPIIEATPITPIHEEPLPIASSAVDMAPVFEVVPLIIRKRQPTLPEQPKEVVPEVARTPSPPPYTADPIPLEESPIKMVVSDKEDVVPTPPVVVANVPSPVEPTSGSTSKENPSQKPLPNIPREPDVPAPHVVPAAKPEPMGPLPGLPVEAASTPLPSIELPPPEIIVHDEPTTTQKVEVKVDEPPIESSNKRDDFYSRKSNTLTLDPELLKNDVPLSPALPTGMSAMSLTDVLGNYFTSGLGTSGDGAFRAATPPNLAETPLSPAARLAYDSPEASPRPKIKPVDPQSFLSPPGTGFLSAVPSSGGTSMGSLSSLGSRPMSMIETSPGHVTRALRMTPATSRGVPMFLPPNSARTRKSDFVHFPPTPDAEEEAAAHEFGSVTLHKASQSMSVSGADARRHGSETDLSDPSMRAGTFSAVVHGKVRETPVSATMPVGTGRRGFVPETPQMRRVKRETLLEPPMSPGQGELAALLQEAVWLEDTLSQGTLPTELAVKMEREAKEREREKERKKLATIAEAEAKVKRQEEERKRVELANAQAKRDEPMSGKLKHTFLIPLAKARSVHHRKEVSTPAQMETFPARVQDDPAFHPKSASVSDNKASYSHQQQNSQTMPQRPVTPENTTMLKPVETPTKSPRTSRFAGFRRLGSISARPNTMHGASARYSNSTSSEISSEDSQPVATPPEGMLEFGMKHPPGPSSEFGHVSNGSTTSFPSLSPRKSTSSLGRATSFAEKMWSRARTKSGASNLSSTSEVTIDDSVPRLPALGPPPALTLSSMSSSVPVIIHPLPEEDFQVVHPPKRSASLKRSYALPPIPSETVPPLPVFTATTFQPQTPTRQQVSDISNDSLLTPGFDSTRPTSWTSMSSAGSLPSPLFDQALFDAFPSVPEATPMPDSMALYNFPHRWDNKASAPAMSSTQPSFDSALLSSAIHLASKTAAAPSTATLNRYPSGRTGAATPTPVPVSRRSGETVR
ncbi:hypothetical protein GALMADRAFT_251556 [Galerina marginata CBS 339.88]|uniref:Uncharacterized protein n=1 Tax=Galerina marginata (strain CBS 339.88) TaxID=685588 RepID=A0A067T3Y1_GALM3|nr:hypothetical protein GALMADRAFT_251556 [Galerina marginata CBS 339.88]